jgi:hypothetical protein
VGIVVLHKGHIRVQSPRLEVEESGSCLELCQVKKKVNLHALLYECEKPSQASASRQEVDEDVGNQGTGEAEKFSIDVL